MPGWPDMADSVGVKMLKQVPCSSCDGVPSMFKNISCRLDNLLIPRYCLSLILMSTPVYSRSTVPLKYPMKPSHFLESHIGMVG
jgi:hypothetical protein